MSSCCMDSAFSLSSVPCCIVSVLETSASWLASGCWLAGTEVVTELWDPGRGALLLGPWVWLVLLLVVLVGVLGGFSTLCCLGPMGVWVSFTVAVSGGLSSGFVVSGSSGRPAGSRVLATAATVCTDSVDAPDDLSWRRSSLDACSSSRMGDSSVSVKTSSEMEPSVLRGTAPPPPLGPWSFRRCSAGSFCWDGCLSAGRGSRSLTTKGGKVRWLRGTLTQI